MLFEPLIKVERELLICSRAIGCCFFCVVGQVSSYRTGRDKGKKQKNWFHNDVTKGLDIFYQDVAKIQNKSENNTSFGGIFIIKDTFDHYFRQNR